MAGSTDNAEAAILAAIEKLAKRTEETTGQVTAKAIAEYGAAAKDFAEAYAWLRTPNNAHGG